MSSDCLYVCVRESEGGREGTSERARERERERERESKASVREKKEDGGTHTHAHPYTHTVKYTHTCTYTPQTGECCLATRRPSTRRPSTRHPSTRHPSYPPHPHPCPSFPPPPAQRCHPRNDRQGERKRPSASVPPSPPFALQVDDLRHQWSKRRSPKDVTAVGCN